jgi:alkylhydroperoxidase family enzyme
MALSKREQELVILRMGRLYSSDYVWKHHLLTAREFGAKPEEIAALLEGRFDDFSPREQALLTLAEAMVCDRYVSSEIWEAHGGQLSPQELVDLMSLVSQYVLFALVNNVFQVPLEAPLRDAPGLAQA